MAKIKFGAVITDSRGTIGGHTFKWSRYGNQFQRKATPTKRLTVHNSIAHARFSEFTKSWWATLTSGQRDDWRALAAANPYSNTWGDEFPLTGLAYYIKLNARMRAAGLSPFTDAPADQTVTGLSTLTVAATAPATLTLTFTTTPTPTDHRLYIFATPNVSPGVANFDGKFFFLGIGGAAAASPFAAGSLYNARLPSLQASRAVAVRAAFLNTDNAALSPYVLAHTTVS